MKVHIEPWDETSTYRNTTMLQLGDLVTVTFAFRSGPYTVKDEYGAVKVYEVVAYGHELGIHYPEDHQFTPFFRFAPMVEFTIIGRSSGNE